jgi:hypothetical protein
MARKKVLDLDADSTVKFEKKGQQFEGFYIGSKKVKSDYGMSNLHVFQTEDGNQGIWGSAKLDAKLANVPAGFMTYITYEGKVKIPGGKTMHKYEVDFDDELSIDVGGVNINFQQSEEPSEDEAGEGVEAAADDEEEIDEEAAADEDENSEDEEEEEVQANAKTPKGVTSNAPRVSKAPASAPSRAAQDKVASLLSKKR